MFTFIQWDPSPVLINFGFYEVRWYSMLFALGFVFSYLILKGQFRKAALDENLLDKLTMYVVVATVLGARLAHCLFYDWAYYSQHPLEILLPFRFEPEFRFTGFMGLASHGGIFAIVVAVLLYARNYSVRALWVFDKLSIVGALAGACIRFGNLMNSEIVGKPADVPWAFVFKQVDDLPRHPGQLYEALAYLLIFALLFTLDRHNTRKPGFIFGIFFVLLFSARFLIEFVKADQADFEAGMVLNMGQLLSIPFILAGLYLAYRNREKVAAHP